MKVLFSCIGIPTIVGQEETPQVESFLPVGQGSISDRGNPKTRVYISNSRINIRIIMT